MTPAETTRRLRVLAANEALRATVPQHQPPRVVYGHAPYCRVTPCCCSRKWVRL